MARLVDKEFHNDILVPYPIEKWIGKKKADGDLTSFHEEVGRLMKQVEEESILSFEAFENWAEDVKVLKARYPWLKLKYQLETHYRMIMLQHCLSAKESIEQKVCPECVESYKLKETCTAVPLPNNTARPKCNNCRDRRVICSWGINIPRKMNTIKVSIHPEIRAKAINEDANADLDSSHGDQDLEDTNANLDLSHDGWDLEDANANLDPSYDSWDLEDANANPDPSHDDWDLEDLRRLTHDALTRACLERESEYERVVLGIIDNSYTENTQS